MRPYSLERLQNMAAFAVSMYSTIARVQKPFKGMQNATYELVYPEKGLRAVGEKVGSAGCTQWQSKLSAKRVEAYAGMRPMV